MPQWVPPYKPKTSEPGGSKDSLPPAWPWSKVSSYRGWPYREPALPACTPGAGSTPRGPEMRPKNRAPAARCEGRVQGLCALRQRGIQPGALSGSPTLASCVLSFPQDSQLPSQCYLWPCWWGMSAVCSHPDGGSGEAALPLRIAATPSHPSSLSVSLSLSLSLSHTHTRPHTFGCLQEELGAPGCTWGSCGQNVRKTPQMAQSCSHESSEVLGGQFPLASHRLRLPTLLGWGPCLPPTSSLIPHTRARGPAETSPMHWQRTAGMPSQGVGPTFLLFLTCTW